MIYFDTVANLMHDIWKGLAPSPIRALFTKSNETHVTLLRLISQYPTFLFYFTFFPYTCKYVINLFVKKCL